MGGRRARYCGYSEYKSALCAECADEVRAMEKLALSCHFALDVFSMRGRQKQGSNCRKHARDYRRRLS